MPKQGVTWTKERLTLVTNFHKNEKFNTLTKLGVMPPRKGPAWATGNTAFARAGAFGCRKKTRVPHNLSITNAELSEEAQSGSTGPKSESTQGASTNDYESINKAKELMLVSVCSFD